MSKLPAVLALLSVAAPAARGQHTCATAPNWRGMDVGKPFTSTFSRPIVNGGDPKKSVFTGALGYSCNLTTGGVTYRQVMNFTFPGTTGGPPPPPPLPVHVASGADATLSNLQLSSGFLNPQFNGATIQYTVAEAAGTQSVTVEAVPTDATGATMTYCSGIPCGAPQPLISAAPSPPITLSAAGPTTITITVTASDKTTQQSYTVVVSGPPSPTPTPTPTPTPNPPTQPFRCINNTCKASIPGLPGTDYVACMRSCGPLSGCLPALFGACNASRSQ